MFVLFVVSACVETPTDSAPPAAEDGAVPLHDAPFDAVSEWDGLLRLDTDGFGLRVSADGAEQEPMRETYVQAWFADPLGVPGFDLLLAGEEGCWPYPSLPADPAYDDVGPEVEVAVGDERLTLSRQVEDDGDVDYWWFSEGESNAAVTRQAGAPLAFDGVDTGLTVAEELVVMGAEGLYADRMDGDGSIVLAWEPPTVGESVMVVIPARWTDEGYAYASYCVLFDDGAAVVPLGPDAAALEHMWMRRTQAVAFESPTHGRLSVQSVASVQMFPG